MNLGDPVLYYDAPDTPPLAGVVAAVGDQNTVTLAVLHEDGTWHSYAAVNVVVEGEGRPTQRYCQPMHSSAEGIGEAMEFFRSPGFREWYLKCEK